MEKCCVKFLLSGKVQGVFYRASTRTKAQELGLTGWVQNLSDGCVELVACGTSAQLESLEKWLWQGPPAAKVDHVSKVAMAWEDHQEFVVR